MKYRVEDKYFVTEADIALICGRLAPIMPVDSHQDGDSYEIRSLYLDDLWDTGLLEKSAGVDHREKYRIRTYNSSSDMIRLEMKGKYHGYTTKESSILTEQETCAIMEGRVPLHLDERKTFNQLQIKMHTCRLEPKVIVDYERTALVHPSGNVRITFDRNISAGKYCDSFLEPVLPGMIPLLPAGVHIMEVKYDELLPDFIQMQLSLDRLRKSAFSKYYMGRMAINGHVLSES